MEIFIKFYILYSRSENHKGPNVIQSQRNVQFIVRLHSNKIHLQNQNAGPSHRFSSSCLTVPVLAFSIRWLPERFGIYIITDHFLKLVQVSLKETQQ